MRTRWWRGRRGRWRSGWRASWWRRQPRRTTRLYPGAAAYHLRLLAGAWILASEGGIPTETAEVFEEAVAWRFGNRALPERLGKLARGEVERDLTLDEA